MTKHKHRPCPCGCGELADECIKPGSGLNAFSITVNDTTRFFTAPDAADEPTIWERTDGDPAVVVRRAELPAPHADLLWRVLTGVLCADDETVERVAQEIRKQRHLSVTGGEPRLSWFAAEPETVARYRDQARAVLAALRGEQ